MKNRLKIPFMEDFKQKAQALKIQKQFTSLGHAQNALAKQYGYKDYNAIRSYLVEKEPNLNRLSSRVKEYKLTNGGLICNGGLLRTKNGIMPQRMYDVDSYIQKEEIKKALVFIDKVLEKRKTINRRGGTSYGLKHKAERYIQDHNLFDNPYISNGAMIVALDIRGYQIAEIYDENEVSLNIQTNYRRRDR